MRGLRRRACAVALAFVAPTTALADHSFDERITDLTAYSLDDDEWQIGLWKLEYGVTETWSVGTYTFPWLLKTPSATVKWNFWTADQEADQISFGARLGLYSLDVQRLNADAPPSKINIVPMEWIASFRRDTSLSLHGGFILTKIAVQGASPDGATLRGAAAGDSTQLYGAFEWRLGRHIAVVGALRVLTSQTLTTTVDETHRLDPYTTVHVAARAGGDVADAEAFKGAAALSGALHGSWGGWNGRLGLAVGNIILPAVNVVLPQKGPMPDFDLYYRF